MRFDADEGFDAREVANLILDRFNPTEFQITNLKINKLLYFAHGFYRARFGKRLIRNHFEAWENGPVVKVIFDAFKKNGAEPITNSALIYDYLKESHIPAGFEHIPEEDIEYIDNVISYYVKFSARELVGLTHRPGTPWTRARNAERGMRLRDRIPDEWINEFFVENFGSRVGN
ncbi:Panacea domain-containing protein [Oricola indica]|uniref:Panacea domain-containing protein n=1 Tax=Oricola indica TaxID=2872591 RepID=UPI003CCBDA04